MQRIEISDISVLMGQRKDISAVCPVSAQLYDRLVASFSHKGEGIDSLAVRKYQQQQTQHNELLNQISEVLRELEKSPFWRSSVAYFWPNAEIQRE